MGADGLNFSTDIYGQNGTSRVAFESHTDIYGQSSYHLQENVNNPAERKYGIQIGGFYEIKENGRGHFPPLEASVIDRYYTADSPNPDEAFDKEEAEKKIRKKKQAEQNKANDEGKNKSFSANSFQKCEKSFPKASESTSPLY
ncbi:hypothetical protein TKK_0015695 [Trichogramma kaykai]